MSTPRISIVVCVYNRQDFIGRCLTSILRQNMDAYELIVVDDGSTDATASIVTSFTDSRVRLIRNGVNRALSYSRNQGVMQSHGQIIAFTDSDCIVDSYWLSELVKPFVTDADIMIVGGKIIDPVAHTYWEKVNTGMNHVASASGYVAKIIGCNMAFQRQFLMDNPFDEYLRAAEEWDLCVRCEQQNKKIFYTDKAIVTHHHRTSLKGSVEQHFRFGHFIGFLKIKHGQFPYFNYGTLILIFIILCFILGMWINQFYSLAYIFCLFYIGLIAYWNTLGRMRKCWEWIVTYPGQALIFSVFCIGNLYSPFMYIWDKTFKRKY